MNHLKTHQTNPTTAQYRPVQSNTSTAQYRQQYRCQCRPVHFKVGVQHRAVQPVQTTLCLWQAPLGVKVSGLAWGPKLHAN